MAPRLYGIDSLFMLERVVQLWKVSLAHKLIEGLLPPNPHDQFNLKSGRITR